MRNVMALNHFFRNSLLDSVTKCWFPRAWASSSNSDESDSFPVKTLITPEECQKLKQERQEEAKNKKSLVKEVIEPKIIKMETPEDFRQKLREKCKIILRQPDDAHLISGVPLEITRTRPARIYQPPKNAAQQGTAHIGHWQIDFDTKKRWENPLMGWCSSGDPISNVKMQFSTKEQAISFCEKNNLSYWVQTSKIHKKFKAANYALNYDHKRRTRVSTK